MRDSIHILLIEDNPADAQLVKEMLNDLNPTHYFGASLFELTQCARLNDALVLLSEKTFDIILVDLSLPDSQGIDTVKAVCVVAPNIPVIVLSGLTETTTATEVVQEGAQDYLLKEHIENQLLVRSIRYAIERKKKDIQLKQLASFDELTHLANRTLFMQKLKQALAMARRYHWTMAILFLDLDRFKAINDNLTHKIGDFVLKSVATRLIKNIQAGDTVGRIGGDEFIIILPKIRDAFSAGKVARRILDVLNQTIIYEEKHLMINGSIGISLYPDNTDDEQLLLKYADLAMYQAKHAGGNQYKFYADKMTDEFEAKLIFEQEIRQAVLNNQFQLYFKPLMDLKTKQINGIEILPFLKQGEQYLSCYSILSTLEELDLVDQVGEWILSTILSDPQLWKNPNLEKYLGCDLIYNSWNIVNKLPNKDKLNSLIVSLNFQNNKTYAYLRSFINNIQKHHVQLALGHFVINEESLMCLNELPIKTIFISSYIPQDDVLGDRESTLIKAIINFAHTMDIEVIADQITTEAQYHFLQKQGCDQVAGDYVSKILTLSELKSFMKKLQDSALRPLSMNGFD